MKKYNIYTLLFCFFTLMTFDASLFGKTVLTDPCPEDENVTFETLPAAIHQYIATNYPNAQIDDAEKYNVNGKVSYLIEFENQDKMQLAFDEQGTFLGSNAEREIAPTELPPLGITNLNTAFTGANINEVGMELSWTGQIQYEVELDNGMEIIVDAIGNMVCEDN